MVIAPFCLYGLHNESYSTNIIQLINITVLTITSPQRWIQVPVNSSPRLARNNAVLSIYDILVRIRMLIRILCSVALTNGSGRPKNIRIRIRKTASFFKNKSHKEVPKQWKSRFFLLLLLDDGRIRSQSRIRRRFRTCD